MNDSINLDENERQVLSSIENKINNMYSLLNKFREENIKLKEENKRFLQKIEKLEKEAALHTDSIAPDKVNKLLNLL